MSSHSLPQGVFSTQELDPGLLHCRQIRYYLSYPACISNLIRDGGGGGSCCYYEFYEIFFQLNKHTNIKLFFIINYLKGGGKREESIPVYVLQQF